MSRDTPKISVGMPVYNGESYLEDAIDCVLNQTDEDFVLIISDNASSDRTEEICRGIAAKDRRVVYSRNAKNIGAASNYNHVFELASGPYFRWFNADDLCAPNLHEECLAALEHDPEAVLSYGKTTFIDQDGATTGQYEDHLDLGQDLWNELRYRSMKSTRAELV